MISFVSGISAISLAMQIPGKPDWMGLYRVPVLWLLGGAAAVLVIISIVSVIRRK